MKLDISASQLNQMAWEKRFSDRQISMDLTQQALSKASSEADELQRGYALRTLGLLERNQSNLSNSLKALNQALEIAQNHGDVPLERDTLNYLAATFATMGNMQAALTYTQRALNLNQSLNDIAGQVSNLINLGNIYYALDRMLESESACLEAIERAKLIGDHHRLAEAQCNLAIAYVKLERFGDAVLAARESLSLAKELNYPEIELQIQVNLAEALIYEEKFGEALDLLKSAERVFQISQNYEGVIHCRLYLGLLYFKQKRSDLALENLTSGLDLSQTHSMRNLESQLNKRIFEVYEQQENYFFALKHLKLYLEIENELRRLETDRQLNAISVERELNRARAEADLERMRRVELGHLVNQLQWQAIHDPLTGIYNRRYLEKQLAESFAMAKNSDNQLSVAMIDVDNFKQVNDVYGHAVGDEVLKMMAKLAKEGLRSDDFVARYGGEEFALVIHVDLEKAILVCERLRSRVESHAWHDIHSDLQVTITVGICSDTQLVNHEKMLDLADEKLYLGKRSGKNQVKA
jgi:diguanylate cyclase (GGDEF)-like protein